MKKKREINSYVYQLGKQRQNKAMLRYASAGGVVLGVVGLYLVLGTSNIALLIYITGLVFAYYLYKEGEICNIT
jgi:hypothetical protein